ncbi:MAG TPA: class I SAM-dependent methyltransferase [Bryobacteraceae bacterium]|nr:class I SAM-dependent methyltransferase [Bryobacteraceae bacterium]
MTSAWDAQRYQGRHSYVWQFGQSLLELLQPRPGEKTLDVGCGTGQLTAEIARSGADVIGLDNSPDMLTEARKNYPDLTFVLADATGFRFPQPFDAVFSNAALHWVKDQEPAVVCIAQALRPGGRFVAEFGGQGNIASILAALNSVLGPQAGQHSPWCYPSIGEFATLLERHGLEVRDASLFDRPTPVEGENGMDDWLRMFCASFFRGLSPEETSRAMAEITARLRPFLYHDGVWSMDYRRLRVAAVKAR